MFLQLSHQPSHALSVRIIASRYVFFVCIFFFNIAVSCNLLCLFYLCMCFCNFCFCLYQGVLSVPIDSSTICTCLVCLFHRNLFIFYWIVFPYSSPVKSSLSDLSVLVLFYAGLSYLVSYNLLFVCINTSTVPTVMHTMLGKTF